MAKRDQFGSTTGWNNGPDPKLGRQFDENKEFFTDLQNGDSNIGNGNPTGRQFQDSADMYTMNGFNIISSTDPDYAGQPSQERVHNRKKGDSHAPHDSCESKTGYRLPDLRHRSNEDQQPAPPRPEVPSQ